MKSALIVVDMQNDFCHPDGSFAKAGAGMLDIDQAVRNINTLVEAARDCGAPVYFIKTLHDIWTDTKVWRAASQGDQATEPSIPGRVCVTGEWGSNYFGVAPEPSDFEVVKHRYSAFFETPLAMSLRARQIERVVLTGVATNVCVEATARDACMSDFYVVVADDACAAASIGEQEASLYNVQTYFGEVRESSDVVETIFGVS